MLAGELRPVTSQVPRKIVFTVTYCVSSEMLNFAYSPTLCYFVLFFSVILFSSAVAMLVVMDFCLCLILAKICTSHLWWHHKWHAAKVAPVLQKVSHFSWACPSSQAGTATALNTLCLKKNVTLFTFANTWLNIIQFQ